MRSIACTELLPRFEPAPPRAAPAIIARDTVPFVEFLALERRGSLLVIEAPGYADQLGRLRRRSAASYEIEAELTGVTGPGALSPSGRWLLAGGPLLAGEAACSQLIDLHTFRIVRTLPIMRPFVWLDDEHLIAQSPNWKTELVGGRIAQAQTRRVDPAIAAAAPALITPEPCMVLVALDTLTCRPLLPTRLLDEERVVALSADQSVVYTATGFARISAVRLADASLLWQRAPVRLVTDGSVTAMALDPALHRLLALGGGVDHDMLVLDARTGVELARPSLDKLCRKLAGGATTRGTAIAFREDGLGILGTNWGLVLELAADGRWSAYKAAGRALQAIAFSADGTFMILGGAEKNLRAVPLEQPKRGT
jgi:hypothetical protein